MIYCLFLLLIFSATACQRGTLTAQQSQDAANAVRQLDRVRVAVSVKSPRNEYDLVLGTARRAVNEKLPLLPDGALKQEIAATLDAYADAGRIWSQQNGEAQQNQDLSAIWIKYDLTRRLAAAPSTPTPTPNNGIMPAPKNDADTGAPVFTIVEGTSTNLPIEVANPAAHTLIWQTAEEHLSKAKELLTKENRIF